LTSERITAERFELLDARGSLRLVTDAVHEDDALCLALASRALWARFPPRPAGGAHVGVWVRTRDVTVVGGTVCGWRGRGAWTTGRGQGRAQIGICGISPR
jgi:hypothetical protein